ncbi:hypothetical protein F5050DRAFT_1724964 [Lentinula boryana]|uniref:Uncharacterized protein n=1 Tax=Lentinula boryana TaxID=40481 RepID=A0ABQ8QSC9_9AGAR|nr:hypothetical protein F5050DRAFT_1724964 [Lentinula boryana]
MSLDVCTSACKGSIGSTVDCRSDPVCGRISFILENPGGLRSCSHLSSSLSGWSGDNLRLLTHRTTHLALDPMHLYRALIPFVTLALALVANSSPVGYHSRASDTYARDDISYPADSGITHNIRDVYPSTHFSEARSSSAETDLFVREAPPKDDPPPPYPSPPPYQSSPHPPVGEHDPPLVDAKLPIDTKAPAKEDEKAPATPAKADEKAPLSPVPQPPAPSGNKHGPPKGVVAKMKSKWNKNSPEEKMRLASIGVGVTGFALAATAMGVELGLGRCKRGLDPRSCKTAEEWEENHNKGR